MYYIHGCISFQPIAAWATLWNNFSEVQRDSRTAYALVRLAPTGRTSCRGNVCAQRKPFDVIRVFQHFMLKISVSPGDARPALEQRACKGACNSIMDLRFQISCLARSSSLELNNVLSFKKTVALYRLIPTYLLSVWLNAQRLCLKRTLPTHIVVYEETTHGARTPHSNTYAEH